jgi:hypothetical protein
MSPSLSDLIAAELAEPVDPRVAEMAAALADRCGAASRAVLFYGSCLREERLDGLMLDFYLIVSSYREAYGRSWLATANRLIPPNVFPFTHKGLSAKYAVMSEADFARDCGIGARSVSVWARFAQPARLAWAADAAARGQTQAAVAEAAPTLFALTRPALEPAEQDDPLAIFRRGFSFTYGAELRAERKGRAGSLVDADAERYRRIGAAVLAERAPPIGEREAAQRGWRRRQRKGKLLTAARIVKAGFTYSGGVEYLLWKINRHSGAGIELTGWQRRWPRTAALILLPRLWKRGAIR